MYVYIVKSLKDNGYYIGISKNPIERLKAHNSGKCFSTRYRRPFTLIYTKKYISLEFARAREKYLKSYKGSKEKLSIIENIINGV